jgi:hypothetical protein
MATFTFQEIILVPNAFTGSVDLRALVQLEGLCQWKIPMTPPGTEPAASWFVAQLFNQIHHNMSPHLYWEYFIFKMNTMAGY